MTTPSDRNWDTKAVVRNQRVVVSDFGGPERLRVIEEEVPRPGVGEVLARKAFPGKVVLTNEN